MKKKTLANVTTMVLVLGAMCGPNTSWAEEGNRPAATGKAAEAELPPPKLTCKSLPVAKATFHRYANLRSGKIKTARGWNVQDWAAQMFNPNDKPIWVTFKMIADDPEFVYSGGSKGTFTRRYHVRPMNSHGFNIPGILGKQYPVPAEANWTGTAEFSSSEPFYVYILPPTPAVDGPDTLLACIKGWLLWAAEVSVSWDEQLKKFVSPYTNYWHNHACWLGGWHSRLILVNRSDKPATYTLEHRAYYGFLESFSRPMIRHFYTDDKAEIRLDPGQKADLYLEDIFGWQKDFMSLMEGALLITPKPLETREKTDVKLYILPNNVTVESLKKRENKALSDGVGAVVDENSKK